MKKLLFIILAGSVVGCSGPKMIDQSEMEAIVSDALITQAIEQTDMNLRKKERFDSVDFYTPILSSRGYTMADFNYTLRAMATRKSNPLNAILDKVVIQIEQMAVSADGKYRNFLRSDSIVMAMFSDTLYISKDTIRGKFKNKTLKFKDIKPGLYTLELDYSSVSDYRVGGKSITYATGDSTKNKRKNSVRGSLWLQRKAEPSNFKSSFTVNIPADTLNLRFKAPTVAKGVTYTDSSYVTNVKLTYSPFVEKARILFMQKIHGNDKYLFRYDKPQDSLALRFWDGR